MSTTKTRILLCLICLSSRASAEPQTFRFDVPNAPLSLFGLFFSADFLGPTRGTIVAARAELHFETDETFDAADIVVSFQAPSRDVPIWRLSGEGLQWQGSGRFDASLDSDAANGVIDLGEPEPDFSLFLVDLRTASGGPLGGRFTASFFEVDIAPAPIGVTPGDANLDGAFDLADPIVLLQHLFGSEEFRLPCGGGSTDDSANVALLDANGDELVNLADVVHALNHLFLGGAPHVLGQTCTAIEGCPETCAVAE